MFKDAIETVETGHEALRVTGLTREEIRVNGSLILSEQKGFLEYANALERLGTHFEFKTLQADYPDPAKEAHEIEQAEKKAKTRKKK